jgi:Zn-dependent peptidase ImmA (M78 family)
MTSIWRLFAWTLGAEVRYRPLDGCEAQIVGCGDRAIIAVNNRGSPRRRRFSLGHEIGHWCHHWGRCLVYRGDEINRGGDNRPLMEKTADRYAANLLVPPYLLRPVLAQQKRLTFQTVSEVAVLVNHYAKR